MRGVDTRSFPPPGAWKRAAPPASTLVEQVGQLEQTDLLHHHPSSPCLRSCRPAESNTRTLPIARQTSVGTGVLARCRIG